MNLVFDFSMTFHTEPTDTTITSIEESRKDVMSCDTLSCSTLFTLLGVFFHFFLLGMRTMRAQKKRMMMTIMVANHSNTQAIMSDSFIM